MTAPPGSPPERRQATSSDPCSRAVTCVVAAAIILAGILGIAIGFTIRRHQPISKQRADTVDNEPLAVDPSSTWRDVLDRIPLGVVIADKEGAVEFRNKAATSMKDTHVGVLLDAAVRQTLSAAHARGRARRDLDLHGPPRVAMVITAEALPNDRAVAIVEDVSERRRVDAVRTDFVANISHELKTPVGALAVLAETLADEDELAVVHRIAGRIVSEAHRAGRTIDDLLELSRIELGEEPVRDTVDLIDVVPDGIARAQPLALVKDITINALDIPDGVKVTGDRRQLISALGNLVENAVKYSENGSSVQVRARVQGRWAELMVADHGIGIPAAHHTRIFERFYRVDKGRGRDTGGTGLGLSIVRHVATNHGGDIQVSSSEGEGSTFVLRIPLAEVNETSEVNDETNA
jgi:two-component system sensor histidine kinase SenX3